MVITKLDVLSGFEALNIAVGYDIDGRRVTAPPETLAELARAVPVYETLPGWSEDITSVRRWADLPANARAYLARIETLLGVPVKTVSVGPERDQLVFAE